MRMGSRACRSPVILSSLVACTFPGTIQSASDKLQSPEQFGTLKDYFSPCESAHPVRLSREALLHLLSPLEVHLLNYDRAYSAAVPR